jgi:hypothetical protein
MTQGPDEPQEVQETQVSQRLEEQRERAKAIEPDGRIVVLSEEAWSHVVDHHRGMERYERDVMATITHPVHTEDDERPGRVRYFSNRGPLRWLRVVVAFDGDTGDVVTAFPHNNEP